MMIYMHVENINLTIQINHKEKINPQEKIEPDERSIIFFLHLFSMVPTLPLLRHSLLTCINFIIYYMWVCF